MYHSARRPSLRALALSLPRRFECSLLCMLAFPLAAPLRADPPAVPPTMVLQVGHSGGITALAYSPDGKTLATAAAAGTGVQLWVVADGQLQGTLQGAAGPVAVSPDGQTLATGSDDGTVRLGGAPSGALKARL